MANWRCTVKLGDFWHDEDLPFEQIRDTFVQRVKGSDWPKIASDPDDLEMYLEEISDTQDVEEFDSVLYGLYNMADYDLVFLSTFAE